MVRRYPLKPIRPRPIWGRGVMAAYPRGIQVLAAAYLALNQRGEGSSPSGPTCTRDVTVASLLAMQDVRVRFPLGALTDKETSGRRKARNPPVSGTGKRGFKSHRPDFCGVAQW